MTVEAYPLQWPPHVPRTPTHQRARANFGRVVVEKSQYTDASWKRRARLTIGQSRDRLLDELDRLGAKHAVISSDLVLRNDGLPRSGQRTPDDPGVAVYFLLDGEQHCMPCDRWDRIEDNLAAVAKHVEAVRGIARWGVGDVKAAFAGFKALPASTSAVKQWWDVLGVDPRCTVDEINTAFRRLVRTRHPDAGGSHEAMAELNAARDAGLGAVQ